MAKVKKFKHGKNTHRVTWRDITNRLRRKGFHTKDEADKFRDEVAGPEERRRRNQGAIVGSGKLTLKEYCDQWYAAREARVKAKKLAESSLESDEVILRCHLYPAFAVAESRGLPQTIVLEDGTEAPNPKFRTIEIRKLRSSDVKQWVLGQVGKPAPGYERFDVLGADGKKCAHSTVRKRFIVLRQIMIKAVKTGLLAVNPAEWPEEIKQTRAEALRLTADNAKIKALDFAQVARFKETAFREFPDYATAFLAMGQMGLRPGEGLGLQWTALNLEERVADIYRTWTRGKEGRIKTVRTKERRNVHMSLEVVAALRRHRARQREQAIACGVTPSIWCFPPPPSRKRPMPGKNPVCLQMLGRVMRKILKRAGLADHFTPHGLRHTFASLMLALGEEVKYVQEQLGHASMEITTQVYGHWIPSGKPTRMDKLDRAIEDQQQMNLLEVLNEGR